MERNWLGKGTYGSVYKVGNTAVKKFKHDMSLIQEYAAGFYLRTCPYIIKAYSVDIPKLSVSMKLYNGSLKEWLFETRTLRQKHTAIKEILKGLIWLNDLNLVHGDLKPGNILCNWNSRGDITGLVIGDLGFVAPEGYSKAKRTAPAYREIEVEKDYRHDIYSFGIIMLEMYSDKKVKKQRTAEQLINMTNRTIDDETLRAVIVNCFQENRAKRKTARYIMLKLYNESPGLQEFVPPEKYIREISEIQERDLEIFFRDFGQKKLQIHRSKTAYEGCRHYISKNKVSREFHKLYSVCTLIIYSAIFGRDGFDISSAAKYLNTSRNKIMDTVAALLNDDLFISYVYYDK